MNNMTIPYVNISKQWNSEKKNILQIINNTMSSGSHVGGKEILKFEKNIKNLCKKKYCVALNSGTDALTFALYSLGIRKGDEVITIPNSFVASTSCIVHLGARPVFVDVQNDQNINPDLIENYITKKTKAIMPVHLTGRISEMKKIIKISKKYNIPIIEDAAQAIGSKYYNQPSGFFGSFGCFSAHPLKNLNALGDSGFLVTNQKKHYNLIKDVSNHGMSNRNKIKNFGHVSRMDNLQAGVLNYRLDNPGNDWFNTVVDEVIIEPYQTQTISFTPIQTDEATDIILTIFPESHEDSKKELEFLIINSDLLGDLNNDDILNIQDILLMINIILDLEDNNEIGDMNGDGGINILDIAILINIILNN